MPKSHSVKRDVVSFCGWEFLLRFLSHTPSVYRGLFAALFETGGRIQEVLSLTPKNFDLSIHSDLILVRNMPLSKRYEVVEKVSNPLKKGGFNWKTRKLEEFRTIPIKRSEPLASPLMEVIQDARRSARLFPLNRVSVYHLLRGVGRELDEQVPNARIHSSQVYPHFFRSQRACQLVDEYGFDISELNHFFGWRSQSMKTADIYARMGWRGLARLMGVSFSPEGLSDRPL